MEVLQFSEQQTKFSQQFGSHAPLHYGFHFNVLISCSPKIFFGAEIVCSLFFLASISYSCSETNAASFMGYPSKDTVTNTLLKQHVCEEYFSANSTILQDIFFKVRLDSGDWVSSRTKQVPFVSYV